MIVNIHVGTVEKRNNTDEICEQLARTPKLPGHAAQGNRQTFKLFRSVLRQFVGLHAEQS